MYARVPTVPGCPARPSWPRSTLPLCADQGIGVIPWSPLARGRLAREWDTTTARSEDDHFGRDLYQDDDRRIVAAVGRIAEARGVPRAQIALAWVNQNPAVTAPIVGAGKARHLTDAIASLDIELTPDEIAELEKPYTPRPTVGFR